MKLFHLSDLHIGKLLCGYSLKENQERVLSRIVAYAQEEHPDAILICGDIYDKSAPSGEAYVMFDRFLEALSEIRPRIPVFIIAGNHDSPERLSYASAFLEKHSIYLSVFPPVREDEYLKKITLEDEYGPVDFYLLPFLKPGWLRPLLPEGSAFSYEEAVRFLLSREKIDPGRRNVILSHQFYTAGQSEPETCDSEVAVAMAGGLDRIDISVLDAFDYAALGHLHGSQKVGRMSARYCGTPYKYSVSEERHHKAVTVVELGEKGEEPQLRFLPLSGLQDVRRLRGTLEEVLEAAESAAPSPSAGQPSVSGVCHDFVSVTITDEQEPYRIRERLEERYDHLLELRVDNARTRARMAESGTENDPAPEPMEAFRQFYETVNHTPLPEEGERIMKRLIREIQEKGMEGAL
ncbi:MAG TPA: exonuclease SbcCD subunit D [Candidatus Eisenbergiella intestinigallinarum]|uniref:Nuclease SbcCD subunit D n=1 Tax=Candidatus Eisenbergiella intestinigallinarum TaxID=2838549 RepID=A0A9D2QNB7_9FIRM|nr:exonuclease SbcCD subunit D [Candidatus Eisenbergiella intestinigallinarum]